MMIAGKNISNAWLAGGAIGLVVVFVVYRRGGLHLGGSSQANQIDPVTGLPYSQDQQVDPLTGMTYLQEAQQYGSVAAAEQAITVPLSSGGGTTSQTSGFPTGGGGTPTPGSYATNAQWAQAVQQGLTAIGYNPEDVAAALGLYLQSKPLGDAPDGASYLSIVQAAVAEFGPPPVGSFPITGTPGPPPPPPPTVHKPTEAPVLLRAERVGPTAIAVEWRPVKDATSYEFQVTPKDRAPHNIGNRTSYNVGQLRRGEHYTVHVAGDNKAGVGPYAERAVTG